MDKTEQDGQQELQEQDGSRQDQMVLLEQDGQDGADGD